MNNSMTTRSVLVLSIAALTAFAVRGGEDGFVLFDGGWRISVGAGYDSGVKSNLRFTPHSVYRSPLKTRAGKLDQATARKHGLGEKTADGKTTFVNDAAGGKSSWAVLTPTAHGSGSERVSKIDDYEFSLADGVYNRDSGVFALGYAEYDRVDTSVASDADLVSWGNDDACMPSISVELSRNLYHNEDYGFGVDLAFVFQYARRNDVFSYRNSWVSGSSQLKSGYYSQAAHITDPNQVSFIDNFWDILYGGAGTLGNGGNGPSADNIQMDEPFESDETLVDSHVGTGLTAADAEYENLEMMLLLRPYYDIFSWLRVNVMAGVVVSRQELDFAMSILQAESNYAYCRDYSQWDVYGVAGGGLMLYYSDFTLSADFLARFLDDDMDISGDYMNGTIQRGRWMFKLSLGYEF